MKKKVTQEVLKEVIIGMSETFDKELFEKSQDELEQYWHFKYDKEKTLESNLYEFYDLLYLYSRFCKRWEEKNNGSCCVVERVRVKYLMPKIKEFAVNIRQFNLEKDI